MSAKSRKTFMTLLGLLVTLWPAAQFAGAAQKPEYADVQARFVKFDVHYYVNDNCTVEKTAVTEVQALTKKVAESLKVKRFYYSTRIENLEVLEAYTIKADGTQIPVPKDNYQVTTNHGNGNANPVFSDRTRVAVVFPDFEIFDTLHIKVRLTETEPMYPENFSVAQTFSSLVAFDDVQIHFNLPATMKFLHQVRQMDETEVVEDGRRKFTWRYQNPKPLKSRRKDYSVWDESCQPGFVISTFQDYASIGRAYGERALPKSLPTDKVKALAADIVGSETNHRQQARLLYDWVVTHITYGGNCIGVGAVVPRDTDIILDNRMGDCKDHAALLEALFYAQGIESTPALVNSGNLYQLPEVPSVSAVNHVITYIPEWDKFVDSTNPSQPFDHLALNLSDKPVILVKGYREGMKTPATQVGENVEEIAAKMKVRPDGSVVGSVSLSFQGMSAIAARSSWRNVTPEQERDWLRSTFSSENNIGSATIEKDDPGPLLATFNYQIDFDKPDFVQTSGANGFLADPPVLTPLNIRNMVYYSNEEIKGYDVTCGNGRSREKLVYEFPKGMKILAIPDDLEVRENNLHYKATYRREGNRLEIVRELDDRTQGNVCSAETLNRQRHTLMKIADNLKSQVLYTFSMK